VGTHDPGAGEHAELAQLFTRHASGLAGAVRGVLGTRADVREVLQEAFLRAWRASAAGRAPRDALPWVFVVTLNAARDERRAQARRAAPSSLDEMEAETMPTLEHAPGARLEHRESLDLARRAIVLLPDAEKEVFLLRASGELSFEAIAEALAIPIGTAKTRMRAALSRLRKRLASLAPEQAARIELRGDPR
jgi:RNA polymerase sigma-70 factor (ECF subfamily)